MLKSNTGVFDGAPMFSKAGRGSPGRNSHGHGSQPNLHSGGTSPLVTGSQTGVQPVSVSVGPPRGGARFHAMDAHLAASRVSNVNSLHRSSPQHAPPQYLPRYGNSSNNTTVNHSPHLQSIQSTYQYHVHHHNHHTPSYPVHSTAQNMHTGPVSVVRTQTPGLQLRDFMLTQWNQFRCQHTSTDNRVWTQASTPSTSTSPVKAVHSATPPSSPSSTPVPPQPGSSSPLSAGGSTDHYCSSSLPRRYTQHHTDCSWPADGGSTGGPGYRRRGGAVAHFARQSSSDGSTWQRGQATVVRKTSSPTAFANRGPVNFNGHRPPTTGASGTSSDSPTSANNNAVGFVGPLAGKTSPQSDPVSVMQPSRSSSSSSSSFSTSNQSRTCFVSRIRVKPTQPVTGLVTTTDTESTFIADSHSARMDVEGRSVTPKPHNVDTDMPSDQLLPAQPPSVSSGGSAACDDLRSPPRDLFPTEVGNNRTQLNSPVLSLHDTVTVIPGPKISSFPTVSSSIDCPSGVDAPSITSPCVATVSLEMDNPVVSPISVSVTSTPVTSQKSNDRADTPPTGERYWTPDPPASPSNGNTMPAPAVNVSETGNETPADCTVLIPSGSIDSENLFPISNATSPNHMPSTFTSCESMPLTEPRTRLESLNDVD